MTFASRLAAVTLAALMCWTVPAPRSSSGAPPQQRSRRPSRRQQPPPRASQGPTPSGRTNWSMPATSSSAPSRAASPRSSSRRSANGACPTATSSARKASGAFVAGLRYGEGTLYTKNAGDLRVYWQGPSVGFDWGGDGARTMMLVYNLPATDAIYQRFAGIDGSAYFIGGFGMTALTANNIVLVPIRSGVGLRLGANIGYLKFTPTRDLEPVLSLADVAQALPAALTTMRARQPRV